MASNSRRRSASSVSRVTSSRNRPSARPTTIKGRPTQGRSPRRTAHTSSRTRGSSAGVGDPLVYLVQRIMDTIRPISRFAQLVFLRFTMLRDIVRGVHQGVFRW